MVVLRGDNENVVSCYLLDEFSGKKIFVVGENVRPTFSCPNLKRAAPCELGLRAGPKGKIDPKSALTLTLLLTFRICPFALRAAVVTLLGFAFPSRTSSLEARFYST